MNNATRTLERHTVLGIIIIAILATFACNAQAAGQLKKVKTFDDMLKYWGINDPGERKYIEDSTKQFLQDEISELVDTKLDVVDYLQVINHLAYGEVKKANNYLAEKVLCKMLENMIGGPAMKILTAAWDFDKYVWTSVQAWAEQQDKDLFHKFLVAHVNAWRQGKSLDEIKDRRQLVNAFNQWWDANENNLGRTKMYGDRQKYYKEFKDACLNRFMDIADRNLQAMEAREALNLALRQKLATIQLNIFYRRLDYKNALRALKRAKIDPTPDLARKYLADKAYQKQVAKLAEENRKSSLENESQILQNADADINTADHAAEQAKNTSEQNGFTIVNLPLGAFNTFIQDYKTIAELAYSGAAYPQEVRLAVENWNKKLSAFKSGVSAVSKSYEKMSYNGKLTESQRKQLNAERKRIRKAFENFHKAILAEYSLRAKQTNDDVYALKSQVKNIQKLYEKTLERNLDKKAWSWQEQIRKKMDSICTTASQGTSAKSYLTGMLRQPQPRYSYQLVAGAISKINPDPLAAMDQVAKCFEDCVEAYKAGLADLQRDIFTSINANDSIIDQRVKAVLELEKAYEPIEPQVAFLSESKSCYIHLSVSGLKQIDFKYHPAGWSGELNHDIKDVMKHLKNFHCRLAAMLDCQIEMRLDLEREKSLYSQAQKLLADANALASGKADQKTDEPEKPSNMAIAILRSGDQKALFNQMVTRNRTAIRPLNGSINGYQKSLTAQAINAYRLNQPPFEGWRRTPQQNSDLITAMEAALDNASKTELKDQQNAPVLKKCDEILKQLDNIARQVHLLSKLVGEVIDKAEKKIGLVQGALSPELHKVVKDVEADKKTLESFKDFVAQAASNYATDNRTMQRYLGQAQLLMAGRNGKHEAKDMQRAAELLGLATEHVKVMEYYALYKGSWRFDAKIKELKKQLSQLGSGVDIDDEPTKFNKGGIFTVSLNSVSIGQTDRGSVHEITTERGLLVIRSESYSRVFQNAKQVILRLSSGTDKSGKFVTVANNKTDFTYQTTIVPGRIYTLELRLITSGNAGYEPKPFPVKFRANDKKIHTDDDEDDDKKDKDFSNALGLPLAPNRLFIISLFHSVQHCEPTVRVVQTWQRKLYSSDRASIIYEIFGSPEYVQRKTLSNQFVRDAYQSILGREPKPAETSRWVNYLTKSRGMRRGVLNSLLNSDEYKALEAKRTGKTIKDDRRPDDKDKKQDKDHDVYKDSQQDKDKDIDKDKDVDREDNKSNDKKKADEKAYQEYIAAYNKLTKLMAAGKGDTPEAQKAYKDYKAAKDKYEAQIK